MDTSGENSRDSVELDMNEIQVFTAMQPSVLSSADILVSDPHCILNGQIHPDTTFKDSKLIKPLIFYCSLLSLRNVYAASMFICVSLIVYNYKVFCFNVLLS